VVDPTTGAQIGSIRAWSIEQFHAGPLPTPETLREYDGVVPGLANAIIGQWQGETAHRQQLEGVIVAHQIQTQSRGQMIAAAIGLITVIGGIVLLAMGKSIVGLSALLTPIALIAAAFIYGEVKQRRSNG
jgi:uncharacterized membrane protein